MERASSTATTGIPLRKLGPSGLEVSVLSIGAMRLPAETDQAVALLRRAIDSGCNYIDTSRGYGDSELKLARALKGGYRNRVVLSTKCSPWIFKEEGYTAGADDARRKIDESMRRLEVDRLDFYQVWNINSAETYQQATAKGGIVDAIHQAMDERVVDHIAATTHAPEEVVLEMIDSGLFEAVTVSYHLLDRKREAVMARAHAKNVGVVVMNPIGGGSLGGESNVLAGLLPESDLSPAAFSLKFVLDHPHVSCAISGFSKMSDVEENVAAAKAPSLPPEHRSLLIERMDRLIERGRRFCTQCGYCMPCEQGVDIRSIFMLATRARVFGLTDWAKSRYAKMRPEKRVEKCTRCGQCVEKCTNKLDIPEELAKAHELLA